MVLPMTDHFLSTTTHYLEIWSRNRQYLEICMPQWQVSRFRRQVASLTFDRMISWHVQLQLIHSNFMDCTEYFESHWHCWWLLSHLLQFTLLTSNQVVSTMFDFDRFIHMDRIVLVREMEIKTLDLVSTIQVARNFVIHLYSGLFINRWLRPYCVYTRLYCWCIENHSCIRTV